MPKAMYDIRFSPATEKYFKKLKENKLKNVFRDTLHMISQDPYSGSQKKGDLLGVYGYDFRYRGTDYEIAYRIYEENGHRIVVLLAGTRENFYEQLKRYTKKAR